MSERVLRLVELIGKATEDMAVIAVIWCSGFVVGVIFMAIALK